MGVWVGLVIALVFCPSSSGEAGCPPQSVILERLAAADLSRASRTARYQADAPDKIYSKAAKKPRKPVANVKGKTGIGVIVVDLPVELLWKAVNDENHFTLDDGYLPVRHSEIIDGTPGSQSRLLFEQFHKFGVGRWWVSRLEMNEELYRNSEGRLWELHWEDRTHDVDPSRPPLDSVSSRFDPIRSSHGAWLLVPLDDSCTLVEYFVWVDPGGFLAKAQFLFAGRTVRDSLQGVVRLAEEHLSLPHAGIRFLRPDGTPLP
jgi:hypothetical protein